MGRERFKHEGVEGLRVGRFGSRINTTCILYRFGGTVVDTGPPNQWKRVRRFLQERKVNQVVLTHHHEDHSGNGARIRREHDATVMVHPRGISPLAQGFPLRAYQKIVWGSPERFEPEPLPEEIPLEDPNGSRIALRALHTPGHSEDMACFLEPNRGWLFSGDLFVTSRPRYLRQDEDAVAQIESLRQILTEDFQTVFCSHRGVIDDGKQAFQRRLDFLTSLQAKVRDLHEQGLPVDQISQRLLGREDTFSRLTGYHFSKRNLVATFAGR